MEAALEGNLPMEERNLLRIHRQTLNRKEESLKEEIFRVNPLHSKDEEVRPVLGELERDIVQWKESSNGDGTRTASGGVLYQFTTQNFRASKECCERLFDELVKSSKVQEKVETALKDALPLDVAKEVSEITAEYKIRAVGPAASEILETGLSELNQLSDILKKIPGQPQNVEAKVGSDRVKLRWEPPEQNLEAVEEYVVYKRVKGGEWEEAGRTEKTRFIARGLK
ncbi:hypothetical protein GBAR_LOCUS29325, partial [Geodia barretti]